MSYSVEQLHKMGARLLMPERGVNPVVPVELVEAVSELLKASRYSPISVSYRLVMPDYTLATLTVDAYGNTDFKPQGGTTND